MLRTAIRGGDRTAHAARLQQARQNWQRALLDQGLLPHLRRYLREDPPFCPTPPLGVHTAHQECVRVPSPSGRRPPRTPAGRRRRTRSRSAGPACSVRRSRRNACPRPRPP
jgi:hypothetical protein